MSVLTMTERTMRDAFYRTAARLLDADPRVAVVLADISAAALVDVAREHPDRVVNVGIREQLMVNVAGGLALEGMRPIAHSYAPFLVERPYEQVKLLTHQGAAVTLVSIGASYDGAPVGRTHQAPEDVALLDALPGWSIAVPGHPGEVDPLLRRAVASGRPAYIRLSERANARPRPVDTDDMTVLRRGREGTVVAVGPMLDNVLAATDGRDVTVLYAATVRPFDAATLRATLSTPDVVIVEPYLAGTSSGAVSEALRDVRHRVLGLGVPRVEFRRYGSPDEHEAAFRLDASGLRAAIDDFLDGAQSRSSDVAR
jgi:transketolase